MTSQPSDESRRLREFVADAFPEFPVPPFGSWVQESSAYEGELDLYRDRTWSQAAALISEGHVGDLYLMPVGVCAYFLPAFMYLAIANESGGAGAELCVLLDPSAFDPQGLRPRLRALLTPSQGEAVARFLSYLQHRWREYPCSPAVTGGMISYWSELGP